MTLCNLIPVWFSSYVNSGFLCTLMNMKTGVVCKIAKNMFGNCWECLSAGKKLIICIMWCVCGVLMHFVSLVSAASHSQKGSHRDRREMIVYEEGLFD